MRIKGLSLLRTVLINVVISAVFFPLIYLGAVQYMAWRILQVREELGNPPNLAAWHAEEGPGFNPANDYWALEYDCRQDDVEIRGVIPKSKYWSIVAYDRYTFPLGSYVSDRAVEKKANGEYRVFLTTRPIAGRPNELNVSACPRGMVLIRTSFPENPNTAARMNPRVSVVPRQDG